jgi:hypothetical protein
MLSRPSILSTFAGFSFCLLLVISRFDQVSNRARHLATRAMPLKSFLVDSKTALLDDIRNGRDVSDWIIAAGNEAGGNSMDIGASRGSAPPIA